VGVAVDPVVSVGAHVSMGISFLA